MTEAAATSSGAPPALRFGRLPTAAAVVLGIALFVVAYRRGGALDLPPVPNGVTAESTGLNKTNGMRERARTLDALARQASLSGGTVEGDPVLVKAAQGLAAVRRGEGEAGLRLLREALSGAPTDLVIGNTYRMAVISLRRSALASAASRDTLAERLPPYLEGESVATLERLYREHPSRETGLLLAVAWVDEIVQSTKPEDRIPAGLASMKVLDEVLAKDPYYVPALFSRGVAYLNPPARVELNPSWQQVFRPSPNAASHDLALCVAIGRQFGDGSPQMVGMISLNLGDAYAKEGQPQRARSWWQVAQNASRDPALQDSVRRRYGWGDKDMLDRLEAEIESRLSDADHPVTDLSTMWHE